MTQKQSSLVLIDGNAIMHRAFHALPPLTNKDGIQTNAVYGFFTMLLTIIKKLEPSHLIVCFDRPEPTFRKSMYVGYQAHRPKMDDELSGQFKMTQEILTAMDVPIYERAGYEADDVIGTLSYQATNATEKKQDTTNKKQTKNKKAKKQEKKVANRKSEVDRVTIITGDRDILQLVTDRIHVYMPVQGLSNGKDYGPEDVKKKYGVTPPQIVDYKAIAGDPSDNYPGVRGIGPKGASKLLQEFETVENVYKAIQEKDPRIEPFGTKTIKALSTYAEDAGMAKKLAKILHDAPVTLKINGAVLNDLATDEAIELLQKHGFWSLIKRITGYNGNGELLADSQQESVSNNKQDTNKSNDEQMSLL